MAKTSPHLSSRELARVKRIVRHYSRNTTLVEVMLKQLSDALLGSPSLMAHVHSTKARLKDPAHLEDKLTRKFLEAKAKHRPFATNETNLFATINDLAGFRILHLHTQEIVDIDRELRKVFKEYRYRLAEQPQAKTWDDENREFFRQIGIRTAKSPNLYTSVHYIIESFSESKTTCEIQVRTLAEELWGEVDHSMNYPHHSPISACREQIKVLARLTSSCTRLVDSIYKSAKS